MIPLTLLVLQAAFLFGPGTGFLTAFTGSMVSAVVAFLIGRAVGRDGLQRLAPPRLARLGRRLPPRGVLAVGGVPLLPPPPLPLGQHGFWGGPAPPPPLPSGARDGPHAGLPV